MMMLVFISSPELNIGFLETELVKAMATHSSILAWRIPRTGEAGGLAVSAVILLGFRLC